MTLAWFFMRISNIGKGLDIPMSAAHSSATRNIPVCTTASYNLQATSLHSVEYFQRKSCHRPQRGVFSEKVLSSAREIHLSAADFSGSCIDDRLTRIRPSTVAIVEHILHGG